MSENEALARAAQCRRTGEIPLDPVDATQILQELNRGERDAVDRLLPLLYDELRRLAQVQLNGERPDHTLQATALVHEAYLRLVDQTRVRWQDRSHFIAVAATVIRRVLVDHARRRASLKRGGDPERVTLTRLDLVEQGMNAIDLIALDDALNALAAEHETAAQVVEIRFFGGLTHAEIAVMQGVSERTVERLWRFARAWLFRALGGEPAPEDSSG